MPTPTKAPLTAGGLPGILAASTRLPFRNPTLFLRLILPCHLLQTAARIGIPPVKFDLTPYLPFLPSDAVAGIPADDRLLLEAEPVALVFSYLSTIVVIYSATAVLVTPEEILSKLGRRWKRIAIALFWIEVVANFASSVLHAIGIYVQFYFSNTASGRDGFVLLFANSALLVGLIYLVLLLRVSLVVLVVGEDGDAHYRGMDLGLGPVRRGWDVIRGRKRQGLVLTAIVLVLEQLSSMALGSDERPRWNRITAAWVAAEVFVATPIRIVQLLFGAFVVSLFYRECKRRSRLDERSHGHGELLT